MKPFVNKSLFVVSLLLVGSLFFSSCHKDNNDPKTVPIPLLASTFDFDNKGVLYNQEAYQHDKQGRTIKMIANDGTYSIIEYSVSTVIIKDYAAGELKSTFIGKLNSKGLCTSISSDKDVHQETFEYDSNGFRKSSINEDNNYLTTFTYTAFEGNYVTTIIESKSKTINSATIKEFKNSTLLTNLGKRFAPGNRLKSAATDYIDKTEYLFYKDKMNTIEYENRGISFMGKQNTNLMKQEIATHSSGTEFKDTNTYTFTYEYDSKDRVTKQTSNNGNYTIYTYVD